MWQIAGALGVALLLTGGAFKMYADKTEAEKAAMAAQLRVAAANALKLENSISSLNEQVSAAEERQQRILDRVNELQTKNALAQAEVESIRKKFAKHDMNVLSLRKPGLIEGVINRGTQKVLSDLEALTNPSD